MGKSPIWPSMDIYHILLTNRQNSWPFPQLMPLMRLSRMECPKRDAKRDRKKSVRGLPHLLTHFPKNPWCDACRRTKLIRKACPIRDAELPHEAKFWGLPDH